MLAGSVIVGEFNPGRILDPVLPESPVEAVKRHGDPHPERSSMPLKLNGSHRYRRSASRYNDLPGLVLTL